MFEADKFSDTRPKWNLIDHNNDLPPGLLLFLKREYSSFLENEIPYMLPRQLKLIQRIYLLVERIKKLY